MKDTVYTHDEAARIVELFEDILSQYNIHVPSSDDSERDADNMIGLYGDTYADLLDDVESNLIDIIERIRKNSDVIEYEFSGNI